MRAYGKEWDYNVYSCIYCLYWKGKRIGCVYPAGCCCSVPQRPPVRLGQKIVYPKKAKPHKPVSKCENCPYGKASPCIGWCTKDVLAFVKGSWTK